MTTSETSEQSEAAERVQTRLFVGLLLTSEVRMHLNQSEQWKQEQVVRNESGETLQSLRYQDKEYIGSMLTTALLPLEELRTLEDSVRLVLNRYCPELQTDKMKIFVFPQLFLK